MSLTPDLHSPLLQNEGWVIRVSSQVKKTSRVRNLFKPVPQGFAMVLVQKEGNDKKHGMAM
jgi:hypothetical protein